MGIDESSVLIIIPARGGSKRIPRKNVRKLCGKPLVSRAVALAERAMPGATIAVTTDDEEISFAAYKASSSVIVIDRPSHLAEDAVPLDPVIDHAWRQVEDVMESRFDWVITLQPTCPCLRPDTLRGAAETTASIGADCCIAVVEQRRLFWLQNGGGRTVPFYPERRNSQWLDPVYPETGAFFITRRALMEHGIRIGGELHLHVLPVDEAVDIDEPVDWAVAEHYLKARGEDITCIYE